MQRDSNWQVYVHFHQFEGEPGWNGIGRGDRIRTYDPLRPRQVRYQAALRPDMISWIDSKVLPNFISTPALDF